MNKDSIKIHSREKKEKDCIRTPLLPKYYYYYYYRYLNYLFTSKICSPCSIANFRSENQHIVYKIASIV